MVPSDWKMRARLAPGVLEMSEPAAPEAPLIVEPKKHKMPAPLPLGAGPP